MSRSSATVGDRRWWYFLRDPRLSRIARAGQFTVPAMNEEELRSAIERPAAHAGLLLEDGLCDLLLRELQEARG
ncbi:hypothetical protein [Streptomyces sp. NPDC056672]|uniref:nSTAND1 domain-containing NTPase n=1 Tax=Streptomyces sp. NPDC056672 TaxID=3345906 RepID=UPI0036AD2D7B